MSEHALKRHAGVHKRNGSSVFQFKRAVPDDLAGAGLYRNEWAKRISLLTSELREANVKAARLWAETDAEFAAHRLVLNPSRVELVTPELRAAIAAGVRQDVLTADENMRRFPEGPTALLAREARKARKAGHDTPENPAPVPDPMVGLDDAQLDAVARSNAEHARKVSRSQAGHRIADVQGLADGAARRLGLAVDWQSATGRATLTECLAAYRQAVVDAQRRDAGEVVATPAQSAAPQQAPAVPAVKGHTPRDAFDEWEKAKPRLRKSADTLMAAADKLAAMLPGRALESLTREDGRDIVAALLKDAQAKGGKAQNTAVNHLARFKTLLGHAVDLEWIDKSPLQGRSIGRVQTDRDEWGPDELAQLFDAPLFTAYRLPSASMAGKDAAYFLPLLGLYTGARISELAQLHTDDLEDTDAAGWVMRIKGEAERGERVKNAHSVRLVPVHPELVRLGLIDYLDAIRAHGPGPLWPAVVRTELNGAGGKVSEWFGKFKTAQGFGREHVFHSFRHTLETRLRALSVPQSHINRITGHAGATVADSYDRLKPADVRPSLERLAFPSLKLARVFAVPDWTPEGTKTPKTGRKPRTRPAPAKKP